MPQPLAVVGLAVVYLDRKERLANNLGKGKGVVQCQVFLSGTMKLLQTHFGETMVEVLHNLGNKSSNFSLFFEHNTATTCNVLSISIFQHFQFPYYSRGIRHSGQTTSIWKGYAILQKVFHKCSPH